MVAFFGMFGARLIKFEFGKKTKRRKKERNELCHVYWIIYVNLYIYWVNDEVSDLYIS